MFVEKRRESYNVLRAPHAQPSWQIFSKRGCNILKMKK